MRGTTMVESKTASEKAESKSSTAAMAVTNKVVSMGIDGVGPLTDAKSIAEAHLAQHMDVDKAISLPSPPMYVWSARQALRPGSAD